MKHTIYEYDGQMLLHPDVKEFCEQSHMIGEPCICQEGTKVMEVTMPEGWYVVDVFGARSLLYLKDYLSERENSQVALRLSKDKALL